MGILCLAIFISFFGTCIMLEREINELQLENDILKKELIKCLEEKESA